MGLPGDVIRIQTSEYEDEGCYHKDCNKRPEWRMQGETDSMGAEYSWWCDDHIQAVRDRIKASREEEHICDGCGTVAVLRPSRCWEEGNNGPVYHWCPTCRENNRKSLEDSFSDDELERSVGVDYYASETFPGDDDDMVDDATADWLDERLAEEEEDRENELGRFSAGNAFTLKELKYVTDSFHHELGEFVLGDITVFDLPPTDAAPSNVAIGFGGSVGKHTFAILLDNLSGRVVATPYQVDPTMENDCSIYDLAEACVKIMQGLGKYGYCVNNISLAE